MISNQINNNAPDPAPLEADNIIDGKQVPVCLTSDFEGRPDLLILFLIQSGVIVDEPFTKTCFNFIRPDHQPKDYSDDDFNTLQGLVNKLLTMFQTKQGIDTNNAILQFLGDYFGNRSLAGKKDKDNKEIVKVGGNGETLPEGKHLFVNGKQKDGDYGKRSNIILCGKNDENVQNYNRTIELNQYVSNIMSQLIDLQNVKDYVVGNHEAYGGNLHCLATGAELDRFVLLPTDFPDANPCVYGKDRYVNNIQTFDDLDWMKNEFINGLKTKKKPLQLFNCMKIGGKNFIFKHTNFATKGQLLKMSKSARNKHEVEFLPCSSIRGTDYDRQPIGSWVIKKHSKLEAELIGNKGARDKCKKYGFDDITTMDNLEEEYNCFVCFGHTGQASENENLTKKNCLCVDCNFYEQNDKEKCENQCNFFRISADGTKIEVINLYTGRRITTFHTFQKTKEREQEKKIEEKEAEMKQQIEYLQEYNKTLGKYNEQLVKEKKEENKKAQEEKQQYDKVQKIRNYIEYNAEIQAEIIDAGSIIEYLNNEYTFKNRGNSITRNIGFDRRRKARFNALCEVLEEKIRDKIRNNTFAFGDDFNNFKSRTDIASNGNIMWYIRDLFGENESNKNETIINNEIHIQHDLQNTQKINKIKEDIANRLNQVGCCG